MLVLSVPRTIVITKQGLGEVNRNPLLVRLKSELYVDTADNTILLYGMRLASALILVIICFSVLSPASIVSPCSGNTAESIQTLDVCHSKIAGANPELPYISECPCNPLPFSQNAVSETVNPLCRPFLITFQDERPPKS